MNALSNFVYGVKSQLADQEGLGGQLEDDDKNTILASIKEMTDWVETEGISAIRGEVEEKLSEVQAVINPITSKLCGGSIK